MTPIRKICLAAGFVGAAVSGGAAAQPAVERLHAQAVEQFRLGRFPEAYGRFIALAEVGHPVSARYALWMCQHGLELFGRDWDCAPHQIEDWALAAGIAAPTIGPRYYTAAGQRPAQKTSPRPR